MTKYCMRKAFKFLSEKLKKENPALNKDVDVGLKHYFASYENDDNFTIPFKYGVQLPQKEFTRKDHEHELSQEGVQLPALPQRLHGVPQEFPQARRRRQQQENQVSFGNHRGTPRPAKHQGTAAAIQKLETIKRLPWTQNILEKTQELAEKLAQHSPFQPEPLIKQEPMSLHMEDHMQHSRGFFVTTPTLRSTSPPGLRDEPIKKVKIEHKQ